VSTPTLVDNVMIPDALLGDSPAARAILSQMDLAAPSRAGVILCGERGSGRQTLARAIHERSGSHRPFVCVDCRQIGSHDIEAELFGPQSRYEQPADSYRPEAVARNSRLHDARDSTLFLRYPGELPSRVQARLARVFRDGEAIDAATGETLHLNIRPIAAVDPPFARLTQDGRMRDELYQRLAVIRIDLPPLRSRREDIPALAEHFLRETCRAAGLPAKKLTRQALLLLSALPWRGNVRELQGFVEALISLAPGRAIRLEDVLSNVRLDSGLVTFASGRTLQDARTNFEREYISAVLEQHRGRIAHAAKALGIQRTNLYRKMRTLGVSRNHDEA
jgi:DNA-binding NtrC family response regulator